MGIAMRWRCNGIECSVNPVVNPHLQKTPKQKEKKKQRSQSLSSSSADVLQMMHAPRGITIFSLVRIRTPLSGFPPSSSAAVVLRCGWIPCYRDKKTPADRPGGRGVRAIGNFNRQCIGPASLSLARGAADRAWILGMGGRDDALPASRSMGGGRIKGCGKDGEGFWGFHVFGRRKW